MNKLSVILNDTPRFLARARNDMGVILNPTKSRVKNLGVILVVFLVLTALFLYFTKGTKAVGWWTGGGGSWQARKQLTITNNSSSSLSANTTVAITIDTATLVSQGKLRSDCADLRVLYQPSSSTTTELSRSLSYASTSSASSTGAGTCSTSYATKVFIPLQAAISASASSTDYYLYYKNPSASAPSSTDNAFDISSIDATLVCPFDGTTTCAAGETPSTETGAIRYSGSKSALSFDGFNDNVNIGTSAGTFTANAPFTLEAWVKVDQRALSTSITRVIQFGNGAISLGLVNGVPRFQFPTDAGGLDATSAIPLNSWVHLAGVYDGTTRTIYVNGVNVKSGSVSLAAFTPSCGSVGSDYSSCNSGVPIYALPGVIDEVRVSTIARYSSNFTPPSVSFVRDVTTRALYHFDENGDDPRVTGKVIDDSGNNFNGTINGAKYISGLVGVDNGTSDTGNISRQSYAGHEGVMIEEGTTNLVTNPSFENSTFNTNWTAGSNLTASSMGSVPYYKFGATSSKLIASASAISGSSNMFTTNINVGSSATHMLSAYVYDGTSGNVGGTVSSSIAKIVFQGVAQTTTYTDMGGGWWRLSYTASAGGAQEFGIEPQVSKTIYVDGVQLEAKSYATTYTDGSLGSSYAWTGTANNSTSTRTAAALSYSTTNNISNTVGSVSFWVKPSINLSQGISDNFTLLDVLGSGGGNNGRIYLNYAAVNGGGGLTIWDSSGSSRSCSLNPTWTPGNWHHMVFTWDNTSGMRCYLDNSAGTPNSSTWSMPTIGSTMYIGYAQTESDQANVAISDFRIFNTALTSTQATDLYQSGLVGHQESYQVDAFGDTKGQAPVSTYHMDEATGSTVYDSTLQANNLTLGTGSSAPSWETSHSSSNQINPRAVSLKFDGSNDYVSRTYDSDFDPGTDSFSVSGWFRHPSTISGQDTLLSRYGSAGYKVYMNSSGYICFGIDDDSTWSPDDSACSTTSYADSKWHSFEAVKTSTTSITLYLDGRSVASDSSLAATATLNTGVTTSMYMGIDSDFASNPWDGYLDEFNFYPYARSAAQVKTDYGAAQRGTTLGASTDDPLTNGLIGYWKMDESTVGDTTDSSGNGYTGTAVGTSVTGGKFGLSRQFNGSSDYTTSTVTSIPTTSGTKTTVSFWVNWAGDDADIVFHFGSGNLNLFFYSGYFGINTFNSDVWGISSTGFANTWKHVTVVFYNGSVRSSEIYVDGVAQTTSQRTGTTDTTKVANSTVHIGGTGASNFFRGMVDEVRIYNRAVTPAEAQQLYNFAPGPVGYWKMDEGSGSTAQDSSGKGNSGSITNAAWTSGKYGAGLKLPTDGTQESVSITDPSGGELDVPINNDYTISTWIKSSSFAESPIPISKVVNRSGSQPGYDMIISYGGGANSVICETLGGSASDQASYVSSNTLNDNNWHNIQCVLDRNGSEYGTAGLYVFIDGILKGSDTSLAVTGSLENSQNLLLGEATSADLLSGGIDDVKFYNYARTQKQILEDMQGSRPVTTAASQQSGASAAVVQYRFDEGQGTTANNVGIGGTGYNGALGTGVSAPTWTNAGKYGKALSFDGGDKVTATITDPAYTNAISLWINPTTSIASKTIVTAGKLTTDSSSRPVYGGCTGTALSLSTWTHIVAVSDGSSICKIYQNGVQTASSTTGVTFGTLVNIASGSFIGSIDEVKVYSHAITAAEAKADYNRGATAILGATGNNSSYAANAANQEYCVPGDSTSCAAPVGEWKFDEATGTSAYDTSGNGYSASLGAGASAPIWSNGKIGSSLRFDGVDDDMSASASIDDTITSAFTISAWFKTTNAGLAQTMIRNDDCIGNSGYALSLTSGGKLSGYGYIGGIKSITGSTTLAANTWYHGTFVYNGSSISLYLNGKSDATAVAASGNLTLSSATLRFGNCHYSDPSFNQYFTGSLDQVRIYNYARSAAQVAYDYNGGKPVAHYRMDECSGSSIYSSNDPSDSTLTGTLTIGSSGTQTTAGNCDSNSTASAWSNGKSGKFNSSLNFDGTDDYIGLGTSASVFEPTSSLSVSAWAKRSGALANFSGIFASRKNSLTEFGYILVGTSANKIRFYVYNTSAWAYAESDGALTSGQWYNLNGVWDGSTVKLYVDGKLQSTSASATTITYPSSIGFEHAIGRYGSSYWPGQIDDVRIYNYALTSSQVKNVYNGGAAVYYGPSSGLP